MCTVELKRSIVSGLKYQLLSVLHSVVLPIKGVIYLFAILETNYIKLNLTKGEAMSQNNGL